MPSAVRANSSRALSPKVTEVMEKHGITRVPVDYFHYGSFRYTNLTYALAEAERQERRKRANPSLALCPESTEEMEKHGITRVPVDYFHYGSFRYTSLTDALAEAERQERRKRASVEPAGGAPSDETQWWVT